MGLYKYSARFDDEAAVARSQSYDLNCSYKDLSQVLGSLKGKTIKQARKILQDAIDYKKAIPYKRFSKGMGHRSDLGGRKGAYPQKETRMALVLLKNAEANANYKGLSVEELVVAQAAAYKQNVFPRYRREFATSVVLGYGKQAIFANYVTARAEMVLAMPLEKGDKKVIAKVKSEKAKIDAKKKESGKGQETKKPAEAKKPEHKPAAEHKAGEKNDSHEGHAHKPGEGHAHAGSEHATNPVMQKLKEHKEKMDTLKTAEKHK